MKSATKVVNKNIGGLFSNKYFLYFMLFLAITSVLGYLQAHLPNPIRNSGLFFVFRTRWINISIASTGGTPLRERLKE